MEELTNLTFYDLTEFQFRSLLETSECYFENLLESKNIKDYILSHTTIHNKLTFKYYNEDKLNCETEDLKTDIGLSVFYINIRSLKHNQHKLLLLRLICCLTLLYCRNYGRIMSISTKT